MSAAISLNCDFDKETNRPLMSGYRMLSVVAPSNVKRYLRIVAYCSSSEVKSTTARGMDGDGRGLDGR